MSRGIRQFAVMLVIASFVLIAVHAYLLDEKLSEQQDCPFCQWLKNLAQGASPTVAIVGVQILGDAFSEPVLVFSVKPHHASFSARSPPSA